MEMNARLSADLYVNSATGSPGGGGGQAARGALASPHINGANLVGAGSVGDYMHTYIHVWVGGSVGVCVCICMYMYMYMYMQIRMYMYMYMCT
jgi:hypothetical protein